LSVENILEQSSTTFYKNIVWLVFAKLIFVIEKTFEKAKLNKYFIRVWIEIKYFVKENVSIDKMHSK
jgi:hypothetical protein